MGGAMRHDDKGTSLSKTEFENTDLHEFASQATGDIAHAPAATGGLTGLAIGTTNGEVLQVASALPVWTRRDNQRIPFKIGTRWVLPGWRHIAFSGSSASSANRLYFTPIFVGEDLSVIRLGLEVGTAVSSSLARLGLYEWDLSDDRPGALVVDGGTVDTSSTGDKEVTVAVTLTGGRGYFIAMVCDAAVTFKKTGSPIMFGVQPVSTSNGGSDRDVIGYVNSQGAQVSGGLADPGTNPASIIHTDNMWVMLRDA
jgi:hypothetical protein